MKIKGVFCMLLAALCVVAPAFSASAAEVDSDAVYCFTAADFAARFGESLPAQWVARASSLPRSLVVVDEEGIRLTREGFLLSNTIISRIVG